MHIVGRQSIWCQVGLLVAKDIFAALRLLLAYSRKLAPRHTPLPNTLHAHLPNGSPSLMASAASGSVACAHRVSIPTCSKGGDNPAGGETSNVVRVAGVVLEPADVAEVVVECIRAETFLILPHPEVAQYATLKASENERWLAGMRKLQMRVFGV